MPKKSLLLLYGGKSSEHEVSVRSAISIAKTLNPKSDELYLNEINTMPGFTQFSMFPKLLAASGIHYQTLLDRLIRTAEERSYTTSNLKRELN
ncbi:hypothetical protein A2480_03895 [Candidatus Uhrbacteria bacterium RIFOXYC2_FULL_47_19]|uniref:ATP-grasp domain-containing protein n=1 Tax=Candidatus Uhrbacteria bacterium RIFOXYC2_FULL_47_19 TaxID=1802424 RepID=A0A1F7WC24_9BACT|nr:MAG: hypothetical protein A2480_03895 [Candidatus Uhrbacteria bacterium RIFOXYC2_FULL_47_19]HCC22398.1 hypothetical protein [Candidatus Uhrbacteria bacterium]